MVVFSIKVSNSNPATIVIGRRGTYNTQEVTFDLSYLVENYGNGTAVLMLKRSQDISAYPAVASQADNVLTWTVSDADTYYVGNGEAQLMWYVNDGLAKTIIYPMVVMRDIIGTTEDPPSGYENWIEHLVDLGEETLENAQAAEQSATNAANSAVEADNSATSAETSATTAEAAKDAAELYKNGAETAKTAAETAQSNAEIAQGKAEDAQASAEDSADRAEAALAEFTTPTASATTLSPDASATASYANGHFTFGIPKGNKGDPGDPGDPGVTPDFSIGTVETLQPTQPATASVTGTPEHPVLNLGIPKGAQGDPATNLVQSVNGKTGAVVLDSGDIAYESTTVEGELGTINSALTSLSSVTEIIDTASGAIASFPDGAGLPMRSLLATIEPQQEGSGDPSPENIRQITGWTGLSGQRLGVNQWDETWEQGSIDNSTGEDRTAGSGIRCVGYIPVVSGASYYLYAGDNIAVRYYWYDSAKAFLSSDSVRNSTITAPSNAKYLRIRSTGDYGNTYKNNWSVNYPSTDTEYHAYTSLPITVSWQTEAGTVYGGTVDVVTGVLTVDRAKLVLDENIPSGTSGFRNITELSEGVRAEYYPYRAIGLATDAPVISDKFKGANTGTGTPFTVDTASANPRMYICLPSAYNTEALFRSWFASNPSEFVYYLATPQTYQLTPQQINTLLGNNTVFVDTGAVTVTYQASIKGYIDKVLAS